MSRAVRLGLGAVLLVVAGGVASHVSGSRPEAPSGGPLAACPDAPNCARVRVALAQPPDAVRRAARRALPRLGGRTGRADAVSATEAGARARFAVGPFRDDLDVAVEAEGAGSVLWVRSASRTGRSDLGVNRARVAAFVAAVRAELEG